MRSMAMLISSVLLTAGLLSGCGGGNKPQSSTPANTGGQSPPTQAPYTPGTTSAQPAGAEIVISNFAFAVPPSVKPGEQVTIVNKDEASHTVTAENNQFDVRVSGGGGQSTLTAPTAPGTYPIYCKYHAQMHGSLTVQ